MSDQKIHERQLNAIIGAAIRGLIESGADDESVGAFAESHRIKVSQYLGAPEAALKTPELTEIVAQSVATALEHLGYKARGAKGVQTKRFNIDVAGRRTSVSIRKEVATRAIQELGGLLEARKLMQDFAHQAPADVVNRSAWIEQRLEGLLSYPRVEDDLEQNPASRH
jgi:hypothetical protein